MMNTVAVRYAEALFQLAEEEGTLILLSSDLQKVVEIVRNNKDLENILCSPLVSTDEKVLLIENLFSDRVHVNVKNFLKILAEKGRLTSLKSINTSFKELCDKKFNKLEGTVISAIPMKTEQIKNLEAQLSNKYNKNIKLENHVDETILGGVLVKLENIQIDSTVKTRLDNIKYHITQVI